MNNSEEVKHSFISAATAGRWTDSAGSLPEPYILYITPNQATLKTFIEDLITEVTATDHLLVDHTAVGTLGVSNLKGEITVITIRDALSRMSAIRSRRGKRPAVLLGTELVHNTEQQEVIRNQFLPALSPEKHIIDLGD